MLQPIISPSSGHLDNIKFKITTRNFIYRNEVCNCDFEFIIVGMI